MPKNNFLHILENNNVLPLKEEVPPTKYESTMNKMWNVTFVNEQADIPMEPPTAPPPRSAPPPQSAPPVSEPPPPPEPELEDKPYTWLAYIAYKALMLDPAETADSPEYEKLVSKFGDISNKSDIKSPEQAIELFEAMYDIIEIRDIVEQ